MAAKKHIEQVLSVAGKDEQAAKLIEELCKKAHGYVEAVYAMETKLQIARFRLEGEQLRELTEDLDQFRRFAHNTLIDQIRLTNRYLFRRFGTEEIPAGGVYSGDPEHIVNDTYRAAIGDWAGQVVLAYFTQRKR